MAPDHADHGDPVTAWRIFWSSELPFHRRLVAVARNMGRRIVTPPHDCCGRPGEPGC
jgi:hypothetical protein